ncbi:MAG: flagellar biosynthesis protein FlhB [Ignavibacteriae bacterium]|nr:flagellar biosynthesis protein FlhB [Ignavibacteriota bacterium]
MAEDSFQEKTEPASDRKREEARRKGKVARSVELNSALVLLFGLMILYAGGTALAGGMAEIARTAFMRSGSLTVSAENVHALMSGGVIRLGMLLAPVIFGIMVVGLASSYMQVGFVYSPEVLRPTFDKLNPLQGIRKILVSRRSLVELGKSLAKVSVVGLVSYWAIVDVIAESPTLVDSDPMAVMGYLGSAAYGLGMKSGLAFLVLAVADYFFQRFEHERDLKMSKEEVKEETKSTEGDPAVKGRIRSIQRRIAYRRMMQDVPKADVVVTNPTHLAVAIKYNAEEMHAPTVVAKGADLVALKIREIANAHNVPIVEDKPLAQTLFRSVEIGQEIPEKLFQAVAQLLAYIYRLKHASQTATLN